MEGGWRPTVRPPVLAVMPEWVFSLRALLSALTNWYVAGRAERGCLP